MADNTEGPKATGKNLKTANPKSTKLTRPAQLRKLLARKSGATVAQIQKAFGWQPHTARAAISCLRKSGESVERNKAVNGAVYRIVSAGAAS